MSEELNGEVRNMVIPLIGGIIEDGQILVRQEIALLKSELKQQTEQFKYFAFKLMLSLILGTVGASLFFFGLVQLIAESMPAIRPWQSFVLVGVVACVFGMLLLPNSGGALGNGQDRIAKNS